MAYSLKEELKREIINKLIVTIVRGDKKVLEKVTALGTWVGGEDKYAKLPKKDQNKKPVSNGDTATLTETDGDHPKGLYRFKDGTWILEINYDALKLDSIIAGLKATQTQVDEGSNDTKFVTPVTLKSVTDGINEAIVALSTALGTALSEYKESALALFHPKGGKDTLSILVKDGEADTKEAVNASQLKVSFEQTDLDALYDSEMGV